MSAAKTVMNVLRFIAAVIIGGGVAYMWMTIRNETDTTLLAGIGVASTFISFVLLYMFGKGGGGGG